MFSEIKKNTAVMKIQTDKITWIEYQKKKGGKDTQRVADYQVQFTHKGIEY